jgi:hypothetical protein
MWIEKDQKLQRTFQFKDFSEAFGFMTRVALLAEQHNHHPGGQMFGIQLPSSLLLTMLVIPLRRKIMPWLRQ